MSFTTNIFIRSTLLFYLLLFASCSSARPVNKPQEFSKWHHSKESKVTGVALVIHGLNLRPSKMSPLIDAINNLGIDALNVVLPGHEGDLEQAQKTSLKRWRNTFSYNYSQALKRASKINRPLFLIGQSLGGGLIVDAMSRTITTPPSRVILLSPAIKAKWYTHFIKIFYILGNDYMIPSSSPPEYRSQRGTSVSSYKALFKLFDSLDKIDKNKINIPTLVFISEDDELVDQSDLSSFIKNNQLKKWKLHPILESPEPHHLIIDKQSAGLQNWIIMREMMKSHLIERK